MLAPTHGMPRPSPQPAGPPARACSQTLSSQGFLELRGTHFSSELGRAESQDLEEEGQPPAGSFLLGPLSCWGLLRLSSSIPVDGECKRGWAGELQEVGPQGLRSNHLSWRADRPGATGADARPGLQGPGSQNLWHPVESLQMMVS